jgi:putative oxygen-independent coproporphyrinogen III oxidase
MTPMFHFTSTPPLALYIHIPWCVRKCPYCDFNSHEAKSDLPEREYVAALLRDLEQELPAVWGRVVDTVFIGGGTPSLFSPESIDALLAGVRARVTLKPDAEITLEANPGTLEQGRFAEFRAAGINRLSIGVQSFRDDALERIGRIHDRRAAIRAAEAAHDAGLDNFNLDLMFGLPDQTLGQALEDLRTAVALEPAHLSWYQLTIEPNTWFAHQPPLLPDDDALWEMQEQGQVQLAQAGYTQYEISAYARDGRQCRHNLHYWRFHDYLGIGAGAHGKITDAQAQRIRRRWKQKHPQRYLEQVGSEAVLGGVSELTPADARFDFALNLFRLHEGTDRAAFTATTGLPPDYLQAPLERALELGLLEESRERIQTTERGRRFLNDLLALFLPEEKET